MRRQTIYTIVAAGAALMLTACTTDIVTSLLHDESDRVSFTATTDNDDSSPSGRPGGVTRGLTEDAQGISFEHTQAGRPLVLSTTVTARPSSSPKQGRQGGVSASRGLRFGDQQNDELTSFRVSAIKTAEEVSTEEFAAATPDFFYNLKATKNANGVFDITQDYYWPASTEKLWFYAYTPCDDENVVVSSQTTGGAQKVTFTVDTNVADQIDLMTANTATTAFNSVGGTTKKAAVPLEFRHELTAIRFVIGEQWLAGSIKSVAIRNVHGVGTLTIGDGVEGQSRWEWKNAAGTDITTLNDFTLRLDKSGVTGTSGEEFMDGTFSNQYFLMIPQSFGNDATACIEVTYQDGSADYTVTAPLKGQTWERNTTVTYAISSHTLTTLKINSITWPDAEWAGAKSAFATDDQVGLYVVDTNNEEIVYHNIPCTFNGSTWSIDHTTAEGTVYHLPGYQYFFYYPYQETMATAYPLLGQGAGNSTEAKDFFSSVINGWEIPADQREQSVMQAKDLQVAKATDYVNHASTVNVAMAHAMGMAKVELQTVPLPIYKYLSTDANYQWNHGTTQNCTASGAFQTYLPYGSGTTWYYLYNPRNVSEDHALETQSITMTTTGEDGWSANVSFTNGEVTDITPVPTRTKVLQSYTMAVGDVLYSDGAMTHYGESLYAYNSKKAIAIVFMTSSPGANEPTAWTHGYALALSELNNGISWSNTNTTVNSYYTSYSAATTNYNGYSETLTTKNAGNSTAFPAAWGAWQYTAKDNSGNSVALTGMLSTVGAQWFLGSSGHWFQIITALGGVIASERASDDLSNQVTWKTDNSNTRKCRDNINKYFNYLISGGYTLNKSVQRIPSVTSTEATESNPAWDPTYTTSTEYSNTNVISILFGTGNDVCMCGGRNGFASKNLAPIDERTASLRRIRPVIGF